MTAQMARRRMDARLDVLHRHPEATARPAGGWVRAIRAALGMSASDLARRMGVTPAAVAKLESSERARRVRLDTLERAADAMGCDVVYALVPRTSLEDFVDRRATQVAEAQVRQVDTSMALEQQRTEQVERDHLLQDAARRARDSRSLWRDEP